MYDTIPNELNSTFAAPPAAEPDLPHALYREDDNGARFLIPASPPKPKPRP